MRTADEGSTDDSGRDGASTPGTGRRRAAAPRGRGRIDRDQVLRAALAVVDAEGLDALTMRRLGAELRCDPMTIYRYTPTRDALLDGVAELVVEQLPPLGEEGGEDWQVELRASAHAFRSLALAHRHVAPLLITRPLSTPIGLRPLGTLRPLERTLALLEGAGFAPADALHVYRAFTSFVAGHVLTELQELVADPEEAEDFLRLGLHRLPLGQFPRTRALAGALARYDGAAELDQGLDVLLSGLRAHLLG
ncbi:TetR/AcrR family transcriptional regulator C-terminal domain-containing protein [Pseudokineococcus marinus]|uniref:TetR family transcriptional regulator n=1 Tax=Pseudokineococcus marinus TaxID=351215 RepID=A0A849BEM0_9ACTN|nr:TetR/AcrR family transcriptional regulator C-terminal domain-containing protein [Pseudokineococcus marinus]NNH21490.1 TetR family transcriptional regulator [Pseudokineococcus marinus]